MLAVEDCVTALKWAKEIGGLDQMIERSRKNLSIIQDWVDQQPWIDFLVENKDHRASTSITLKITDSWFDGLDEDNQWAIVKEIVARVEGQNAGYDFANHRDAVPGFRIWGGSTVDSENIKLLLPWLEWAYKTVKQGHQTAAK